MDLESSTAWAQSFDDYFEQLAPLFQRSETRQSVRHYVRGLLAEVKRKNTWQMAEVLGLHDPHPLQRVLNEALWDAAAVRRQLRKAWRIFGHLVFSGYIHVGFADPDWSHRVMYAIEGHH